jgi:hypothetical protein
MRPTHRRFCAELTTSKSFHEGGKNPGEGARVHMCIATLGIIEAAKSAAKHA